MLIRKPTTITLKPEDDYAEFEEYKQRQELQKKNLLRKDLSGWPIPTAQVQLNTQVPKNTKRSEIEFSEEAIWDSQPRDQVPIHQLFRQQAPDARLDFDQ